MFRSISLKDAFWSRETKTKMCYAFWSSAWYYTNPWTFDRENVRYFSKFTQSAQMGTISKYFIGPLLIVVYDVSDEQ